MNKIVITPQEVIGRRTARGFGHLRDGTPIYEWEEDVYPDSPGGRALREERKRLGIGLREAARILEIRAVELSNLERGHSTCDFELATALLQRSR